MDKIEVVGLLQNSALETATETLQITAVDVEQAALHFGELILGRRMKLSCAELASIRQTHPSVQDSP